MANGEGTDSRRSVVVYRESRVGTERARLLSSRVLPGSRSRAAMLQAQIWARCNKVSGSDESDLSDESDRPHSRLASIENRCREGFVGPSPRPTLMCSHVRSVRRFPIRSRARPWRLSSSRFWIQPVSARHENGRPQEASGHRTICDPASYGAEMQSE